MKFFRQLGFLKLPLRREPQASEEDLRILNLFRNRAELKKAYGELQKEVYRLKDRIKQQEGATQRAQDMLSTLEGQLSFAETGYPALVFYQLRRLWQTGRELLEQLVADLMRRQDQHERQQHFAEHHKRQTARLESADQQQRAAERRLAAATVGLQELLQRREKLSRLWHYFKRRQLQQPLAAAQAEQQAAEAEQREARGIVEGIQREPVPEFPGLSHEARRAINLRAIAYAQVLCLRLAGTEMVRMAREATTYREISEEYGSRSQCEALMEKIDAAQATLKSRGSVAQEIKARTDWLRTQARYRNPADTAPTAESVLPPDGESGVPNVLAEDTWDIYKVLLR
jgi:hypothetical protein